MNYLKVATTSDHVRINKVWSAMGEDGTPGAEFVEGSIEANVRGVVLWAEALRGSRAVVGA